MGRERDALRAAAERERDALRAAAEREKGELRARAALLEQALREQQKRGSSSQRGDHLAKRVRIENDSRLQKFHGSLCDKINKARDTGEISFAEADNMHEIR